MLSLVRMSPLMGKKLPYFCSKKVYPGPAGIPREIALNIAFVGSLTAYPPRSVEMDISHTRLGCLKIGYPIPCHVYFRTKFLERIINFNLVATNPVKRGSKASVIPFPTCDGYGSKLGTPMIGCFVPNKTNICGPPIPTNYN